MSTYGAVTISEGMQGPTFSKLGQQISAARNVDVTQGGALSGGQGMLILFADMRDSLLSIQQNTLETVELLRTAIAGDPVADRDASLSGGDTDDTDDDSTKKPGVLARVGRSIKGAASSLFGSTLGKLALAAGGFALLKIFGDDAVAPLADLIKTIKQGKIGENIKSAYEYIKQVGMDAFEGLKTNTIAFIDGVKEVMGIIQSAYTMVNDYIMSFDVKGTRTMHPSEGVIEGGDGVLDEDEFDALKEDLKEKTVEYISSFFKDVLLSLAGGLLGLTLINQTVKLAAAKLTPLFSGTSTAALTTGAARLGMGIPIAGLLIYGVTTTWSNISSSLEKTLEENDGKMDYSDFFANFLGGDGEGGVMNALKQGFKVGGTFALAGMAVGAAVGGLAGFGIGAIPGALMGGLIGTGIGFLVGAFTGWLGSDKLKKIGDAFTTMIDDTVETIKNFFMDIADSIKSFFTGSTTTYETDAGRIGEDLKEANEDLEQAKLDRAALSDSAPTHKIKSADAAILNAEKEVDKYETLLENVPEAIKKKKQEDIASGTMAIDNQLERLRQARDYNVEGLKRAIENDNIKGQKHHRAQIKFRNEQILAIEAEKQNLLKTEYDVDYEIPKIKMDPIVSRFDDPSFKVGPGHPSNATFISGNNNDSSVKQINDTYLTGNLVGGRPENSGKLLASKT